MQNLRISNINFFIILTIFILLLTSNRDLEVKTFMELPQIIKSPKYNEQLSFAGETLKFNADTKERMEKELLVNSYHHTSTVSAIKLSTRFFPMIERILAYEGIPEDFKYLAVAESNLSNVTSPAGAKGLWQFIKSTGIEYGLEINNEIDERYNYEKSTKAAAKYIKYLFTKTGSWTNAAAAYNMGFGNLTKTMESQKEYSYYDINLNEETSRYVFRIIAIKEILSNPENFGFFIENDQKYQNHKLKKIEINSPILDLSKVAHENGISYRLLKYYNPWLIDNKISSIGQKYLIEVPE